MKKITAVILFAAMLLSSLFVTAFAQNMKYDETYTLGDANGDGNVNAIDIHSIKAMTAGYEGYTVDPEAADVEPDGIINAKDVFYLKAAAAGALDLSDLETSAIQVLKIDGVNIKDYCIVVPEWATKNDNVHYAAECMKKYVKTVTGVTLDICKGDANATKPHKIVYHALTEGELFEELGWDGYKLEVADGQMDIYGGLRGNMYGTYDVIEKYLGITFYSNEESFVIKQRVVDITADASCTYVPGLTFRHTVQTFGSSGFEEHFLPMKLNGTQIYRNESDFRYGTLTGPIFINAHSYGYYWQMSTGYQKAYLGGMTPAEIAEDYHGNAYKIGEDKQTDHGSDWNGLAPWQPCPSSEEDYNNEFEGLCMTIAMKEQWGFSFAYSNEIFSFSPLDNIGGLCPCRICSAKADGRKLTVRSLTDPIFKQLETYGGGYRIDGKNIYFDKENYSGLYQDFLNRACYDVTHEEKKYYTGSHVSPEGESYVLDLGDLIVTRPNLQLMAITYDLTIPATVKPAENSILMFCGQGCNHHYLGTEDCKEITTVKCQYYTRDYTNAGESGTTRVMKAWAELCHETGAQLWFWTYPTTYSFNLAPTPNIYNMYYDLNYLINEIHVDGVYYEGGGGTVSFEPLKAHMATTMMYHNDMTFDDFVEEAKNFLHAYYGDGYEYIWQYIEMIQECSDQNPHCYINNYSNPTVMYNYDYLREHYLEMRDLLLKALAKADIESNSGVASEYRRVRQLIVVCDTIGLESVWEDWYKNGNNVKLYKEMYDAYYAEITHFGYTYSNGAKIEEHNYDESIYTQGNYGNITIRL